MTPYNTALSLGNAILGAVRRSESLDEPLGDFKFQQLINALKDKQYIFLVTSRLVQRLSACWCMLCNLCSVVAVAVNGQHSRALAAESTVKQLQPVRPNCQAL